MERRTFLKGFATFSAMALAGPRVLMEVIPEESPGFTEEELLAKLMQNNEQLTSSNFYIALFTEDGKLHGDPVSIPKGPDHWHTTKTTATNKRNIEFPVSTEKAVVTRFKLADHKGRPLFIGNLAIAHSVEPGDQLAFPNNHISLTLG